MIKKYYFLIYREIKILTTYKSLLITILLTPAVYLLLFSLSLSSNIKFIYFNGIKLSYLNFIIPGLLAMQTFSQEGFCLMKTSNDKRFGMIRMLLTNDVSLFQYFISRMIGSFIVVVIQCFIVILIGIFIFRVRYQFSFLNSLIILITIFFGTCFWSIFGFFLGITTKNESTRDVLQSVIPLPVLFSSSVFYDIEKAPYIIRIISKINPLSLISNSLRNTICLNIIDFYSILVLIIITILFSLITIYKSNKIELLSY